MKKSRKILSILLCLVAVLSFTVGCSKTNTEDKVIKVGATQVPGGDLFEYLKDDIKKLADEFDHSLIIEDGTLKEKTVEALKEENFKMIFVDFRPTAESFAKYFYDRVKEIGYDVKLAKVYETPNNMAAYGE